MRPTATIIRDAVLELQPSSEHLLTPVQFLLDLPVPDKTWATLVPEARRRRIIDAAKCLIAEEANRETLVLIFEDLHWIDEGTQAVLDAIVEVIPSTSLLLLINYRPEYRDRWADRSFHTRISLGPLPPSSADELLSGLLGDDPSLSALKRLLINRTAANPLFLEESARALMEEGVLERSSQRGWKLTHPFEELEIPASIQSIIAARIDRRPPDEKTVLQSAAVIGMEVPFSLLAELVGQAEESLRQTLAKLQAAEFLYETRLFPELEFSFKHALTHDVAYKGLLKQRRRELHARIVSVIECQSPERIPEMTEALARHAFEGGVWDKAVDYNRRAADRALNRSAYQEAFAALNRAINASEQLPDTIERIRERIDLRFDLAGALYPLGRNIELTGRSEEALKLATQIGDDDRIAYASARLGVSYWTENRLREAVEASTQAVEIATPATRFLAYQALGCALRGCGRYREAIHMFQEAIDATDPSSLTRPGAQGRVLVHDHSFVAWCLTEAGDLDAAIISGETAIAKGKVLLQAFPSAVASFTTARAYREKRDPEHGAAILEKAVEACTTGGVVICFPWVACTFGRCLYRFGPSGRRASLVESSYIAPCG